MTSRGLAEWAEEVHSLPTKPDTQKLLDSDYIYDQAYTDGHHAGMHEIFNHLDNYIEFVNDLDKLRRYGEAARTDGEGAGQCLLGIKF